MQKELEVRFENGKIQTVVNGEIVKEVFFTQFGVFKNNYIDPYNWRNTETSYTIVPVIGAIDGKEQFLLSETALGEIEMDRGDWIAEGEEQPSDDYYHEKFYGELLEVISFADLNSTWNELVDLCASGQIDNLTFGNGSLPDLSMGERTDEDGGVYSLVNGEDFSCLCSYKWGLKYYVTSDASEEATHFGVFVDEERERESTVPCFFSHEGCEVPTFFADEDTLERFSEDIGSLEQCFEDVNGGLVKVIERI